IVLEAGPDLRILALTLALSIVTGLVCGLAPALQATRTDLALALKDEGTNLFGRYRASFRRILVVAQVAISLMLLYASGLLVRSLQNLRGLDAGFSSDRVLLATVNPGQNGYTAHAVKSFYADLTAQLKGVPGVDTVSLAVGAPL